MTIDKKPHNFFESELINNGYVIHKPNDIISPYAYRHFQKKITDDNGILYFINIYHYKHEYLKNNNLNEPDDGYTFKCQFKYDSIKEYGQDMTIDISLSGDFLHNRYRKITRLKEVEEHIYKIWKQMGYDYYEMY